MGNKCHCVSHEKTKEVDLRRLSPDPSSAKRPSILSESKKNRLGQEPLKSLSQILEEDDYLKLLFSFERETHGEHPDLDERSAWVLKREIRTPLPVIEPRSLAIFLREKQKHDFLRPSASPFLATLAQIDFCLRNGGDWAPSADPDELVQDFLSVRSLAAGVGGLGAQVMSPVSLNQGRRSLSKTAQPEKPSRRRESKPAKPELASFAPPEAEGAGFALTFGQRDSPAWPCPPVQTSRIFGPVRFPSREVYMGEVRGGLKEGYGIQIWPDGSLYEGYWRGGDRAVLGLMVFSDGDFYEGEWSGGKMHGAGVFRSPKTFEFRGSFRGNEPEGRGEERWECKVALRGTWARGKRNGLFEVSGRDWSLRGPLLENESTGPLALTRGQLSWTLSLVSGFFEGAFECCKEAPKGPFSLNGTLIRGKVSGKARAVCAQAGYDLAFSQGQLLEAVALREGKPTQLRVKNGRIAAAELPPGDPLFVFEAVAGLEGVCVPFL